MREVRIGPSDALTVPCDKSNVAVHSNPEIADELLRTRQQRDECASRMDALRGWGKDGK